MQEAYPPKTIKILSDNNVLTYQEAIRPKGNSEVFYVYKYTKTITKKGLLLELNKTGLDKLINIHAKHKKT